MGDAASTPSFMRGDSMQNLLTTYASDLSFDSLTPRAIHATKVRTIDTIGALFGGFYGEPCRLSRNLAAKVSQDDGSTVIGTRIKTTPDLAAFANATSARFVEFNDMRHAPNSHGGHTSDVLMPILAAGEHVHASGRDFITAAALVYEVFIRIGDVKKIEGWDYTLLSSLGIALASAKLFGLSSEQLYNAISMAIIPNNALRQTRTGELSMWKAVAAGQAGRAGVFAALLARENFEGPHLPFEGKNGWFDRVANGRFDLDVSTFGNESNTYAIEETIIKIRPSCGETISAILAAEDAYPRLNGSDGIEKVNLELYKVAIQNTASSPHDWNPDNRESADHSTPYVVAATLLDGTITPHQFDDAHLASETLHDLISKIEVVENPEFTKDYESLPMKHRSRVTVVKKNGETVVGESGGSESELASARDDGFINEKFTSLTQQQLGLKQVRGVLDRLWQLEDLDDVADIPAMLVM